MLRLYPLAAMLQAFCLYHAYSKRSEYYWYFVILFFPFIGSFIYLYIHFYSRHKMDNLKEGVKTTLVSNYKIDKLEQQLKYSDTVNNRMELADEYSIIGQYDKALDLYHSCNEGSYKDDPHVLMKLVKNHYLAEDYPSTLATAQSLMELKEFQDSDEQLAVAWSYYHLDQHGEADKLFQKTNKSFTNYKQRLDYANFLYLTDKSEQSLEQLAKIIEEIDSMDQYEKRLKKQEYKQAKSFYKQIVRNS